MVEYALILACVALGALVGLGVFGGGVGQLLASNFTTLAALL